MNTKWELNKSSPLLQKHRENITLIYILEVEASYKKRNVQNHILTAVFPHFRVLQYILFISEMVFECLWFKLSLTIATTVEQIQDR